MLASLWVVAAVIFVAAGLLYHWEDQLSQGSAVSYRRQFDRLIVRLEDLVRRANQLEAPVERVLDVRLMDSYLSHLKMLETLMLAMREMPVYSTQPATLKAPMFLVDDMILRFNRLAEDIDTTGKGRRRSRSAESAPMLGCYFCSRPFEAANFHKVRVKVDGTAQDVAACKICNGKLIGGKKAKVLFFSEGGETVHWSKAKDYAPSAQFWGINDESQPQTLTASNSGTHLTLVYSNVTPLSSRSRID